MRSNQKTRKFFLIALICYLIGLCFLATPWLDSGLRFLYTLGYIAELSGVCFSLLALRAGNRA